MPQVDIRQGTESIGPDRFPAVISDNFPLKRPLVAFWRPPNRYALYDHAYSASEVSCFRLEELSDGIPDSRLLMAYMPFGSAKTWCRIIRRNLSATLQRGKRKGADRARAGQKRYDFHMNRVTPLC